MSVYMLGANGLHHSLYLVPLRRAYWSLLHGVRGILNGSWGDADM